MEKNQVSKEAPKTQNTSKKGTDCMDNVFRQTDETFYETQYSKCFPSYTAGVPIERPASATDAGLQVKGIMESEFKPKESQYRERWHQLYLSQQEPVGGQKFLRTVDSLDSVKNLTHGAKSKVENNFANLLYPNHDLAPEVKRILSYNVGDGSRPVTYGRRTNSDQSGGCLWKIFNHDALSPVEQCGANKKLHKTHPPAETRLKRCSSLHCERYDIITQELEKPDAQAINGALQYLHKVRSLLSSTGAVQNTRKELQQAIRDGNEVRDWNDILLKYIGTEEALDHGALQPLLRRLAIDTRVCEGFSTFLDLLDSEISLAQFKLGGNMQNSAQSHENEDGVVQLK